MASTYKVPIAVKCLLLVESGILEIDQRIYFSETDMRSGSGVIKGNANLLEEGMTLKEMLRMMLVYSDNTATDLILKLVGGPSAVTSCMESFRLKDINVSRTTLNILADYSGIEKLPSNEQITIENFSKLEKSIKSVIRQNAMKRFFNEQKDTATPESIGFLLEKLHTGLILNNTHTHLLFHYMKLCKTGATRIKALLPSSISLAHKTGTLAGSVNDIGLIYLPNNEHIVIVVNIHDDSISLKIKERIIAEVSRAIYDSFMPKVNNSWTHGFINFFFEI